MKHKQLIAAFLFIVTNNTANAMLQLVPHSPTAQSRQDEFIRKIRAQNTRVTLPHQKKSATIVKNHIWYYQATPQVTRKHCPRNQKNRNVRKKIYACAVHECYKEFICRTALNNHKVVHTGEKPFVCQHCKFKFSFNCNLKRHMKNKSCKTVTVSSQY